MVNGKKIDPDLEEARKGRIKLTPEQAYEVMALRRRALEEAEKFRGEREAEAAVWRLERIKHPLRLAFRGQEKLLTVPRNVTDQVFEAASGGTPVIEDGWRESKIKHQEAALEALLQPLIDAGVISVNYSE